MGLSFITPDKGVQYVPLQISSSSISSSSVTGGGTTEVGLTTSFVNEGENATTSTNSTSDGTTSQTQAAYTENKFVRNASSTGLTDFASFTQEGSYEFSWESSSTDRDSDGNGGSASVSASGASAFTSSSSRGFTDQTIVNGSQIEIKATTQQDGTSSTFSTTIEWVKTVVEYDAVGRGATVAGSKTTTAETQSFASKLTTGEVLTSSTTNAGTGVSTASTTTTSTNFIASWLSTNRSKLTTTAPFTERASITVSESVGSFTVDGSKAVADRSIRIATNADFYPIGIVREIEGGGVDILFDDDREIRSYSRSDKAVSFVNGDRTYKPKTREDDQNVTFITVNASEATKTREVTITGNPAHNSSESKYDAIGTEQRTFCEGSTTGTYAHRITSTASIEESDEDTYLSTVTDALTTESTVTTNLISTAKTTVNINHPEVDASSIFTTSTVNTSTNSSTTVTVLSNNGAVIVGDASTDTETQIENGATSITQGGGYTFGNDSNRAELKVQRPYYEGGVLILGNQSMTMNYTRTVAGYAPFNMPKDAERPNPFLGFTTSLVSSEGFASWSYRSDGAIQHFNRITNLDDTPCRTISETFTHSDVTFAQTITDSDNIQFFDRTVTRVDDLEVVESVIEASTGTKTFTTTNSNGDEVESSTTTGNGHSVPATTTTSALVTMSRTWTTGFMTDDANTAANATARSLTYRGKHGNKGTIVVELCNSIQHTTFESTARLGIFRGPIEVTVRAPYHFSVTMRDSKSTTLTEYSNGDRNADKKTEALQLDRDVEYSISANSLVGPNVGGPSQVDAATYDFEGYQVLKVDTD